MLDSNGSTRITASAILCHPWLKMATRKLSLEPRRRPRRVGICNSKSTASKIANKMITSIIACCECSCHEHHDFNSRDSAFINHCEECDVVSPIPGPSQYVSSMRQRKGNLSTSSSGYVSSFSSDSLAQNMKDVDEALSNIKSSLPDKVIPVPSIVYI